MQDFSHLMFFFEIPRTKVFLEIRLFYSHLKIKIRTSYSSTIINENKIEININNYRGAHKCDLVFATSWPPLHDWILCELTIKKD